MRDKETVIKKLKEEGLKLTPQRLAVIEFLDGNTSHPSADIIFQEVEKKYPMISFSTVYNTLKTLERIGEVVELTIIEGKINFDPRTDPHFHFLCEECNQIKDVSAGPSLNMKRIEGHTIKSHQVYFYGICSECLERSKSVIDKRKSNNKME